VVNQYCVAIRGSEAPRCASRSGGEERDADDRQRDAQRSPRRLQEEQHAGHPDHEIERRRQARAVGDLGLEHEQIGRTRGRQQRQQPVIPGDAVAGGPARHREGGEDEEQREGQMDGARFGGVEDADAKLEGERGGIPQLEQCPEQRDDEERRLAEAVARLPRAGVGFRHQPRQLLSVGGGFRGFAAGAVVAAHHLAPSAGKNGGPS
jgi:hypothetical protein